MIQIICEYFIVDEYFYKDCRNVYEVIIPDPDRVDCLRDCLDRFLDELGYESYRKKCPLYKYLEDLYKQSFQKS